MLEDRYDGITIGTLCTERWIEKNAVLSLLLAKAYFPALRSDLAAQDSGVLNAGADDTSNVYVLTAPPFNPLGGIDVNVQDQTTELIDLKLSRLIQTFTIAINTSIDDRVINANLAAAPTVGNLICLKEDTAFYQGIILSFVDNTGGNYDITIDTPLDFAFTVAGGCSERSDKMNVLGSPGSPLVFSISPVNLAAGTEWDIVRFIGVILDDTAMDDGKFGGITALINGVVFRKVDGIYKNLFNAKTNGDLKLHMYDVDYSDKAPAGQNGLNFRRTFGGPSKNGVVIRLAADNADQFQVIIQDDLTTLTDFRIVLQGHLVD